MEVLIYFHTSSLQTPGCCQDELKCNVWEDVELCGVHFWLACEVEFKSARTMQP